MPKRMPWGFGSISGPDARGYWSVRITVGKTPEGRQRRETRYAKSQAEATRILKRLQEEKSLGARRGKMPTVAEHLASWIARKTPELEAKSIRNYRASIDNLVPFIGHIRLDRLTAEIVARSLEELRKQKRQASARREALRIEKARAAKKQRPRKAAVGTPRRNAVDDGERTVQMAYDMLRAALNFAVRRDQLLVAHPLPAVPRPRVRREIDYLDETEARAFLAAVADDRYRALWHLAVMGELLALEWRDVDLSAGRLSVRRTLKESRTVGRAKSATSHRLIDLPRSIVAELRAHRKSKTATDPNGLVFTTAAGTALHRSNLERRHFFPALARAGVRRIRFHDLRHTCATLLLKSGVNPKVVSELMGHSSPTTTLALYGHTLPGMGREAAAQMDRLLWGDARSAPG